MSRKRVIVVLLTVGVIFCLGAVLLLYMNLRQQTNFSTFLGDGGEAQVSVPAGFQVNVFATGLNGPRFIHFGPDGRLFAADRNNDRIVILPDEDRDGQADEILVFAENINNPHSLVYRAGAWYIGVPSGVIRLEDTNGDDVADVRTPLVADFIPPGQHSTRTVAFLPDGRMVLAAGSTCNICEEEDPRRAAVTIYDDPVGENAASGERVFATGLRNAVGLAVHPETGELWASNNGRDLMGDDLPPENIYIVREGENYGWPYCHSGTIEDPDMGFAGACTDVAQPIVEMQAHMAPLGITFYNEDAFPDIYRGGLFIAMHGSWNRSEPVGYKVMHLPLAGSQPAGPVQDFASGWLQDDGSAAGRPVGMAVGPEGALFVSDDRGGIIYRISYDPGES